MEEVADIQGAYDCISHFFAPGPGTPMLETSREYGIHEPLTLADSGSAMTPPGVSPWVDAAYLDKIRQRTDYFYPFGQPNFMLQGSPPAKGGTSPDVLPLAPH